MTIIKMCSNTKKKYLNRAQINFFHRNCLYFNLKSKNVQYR